MLPEGSLELASQAWGGWGGAGPAGPSSEGSCRSKTPVKAKSPSLSPDPDTARGRRMALLTTVWDHHRELRC